jgi:hypothetical protein
MPVRTPPPTPQPVPTPEAFCGGIIGAGERRVLNGNLDCSKEPLPITVENGGKLDCKGYTISFTYLYGIEMTGTGSKVTNCNVIGYMESHCVFVHDAFDDTPHTIVNSSVSGCAVGFDASEGAVRIESSSAFDNIYGVFFVLQEQRHCWMLMLSTTLIISILKPSQ